MSELKYFFSTDGEVGTMPAVNDFVYLKSEADKLIAELEERIADGDKDFEMADSQNQRLLKFARHNKYKRCLAMAMWCASRVVVWTTDGNERKSNWYWKWKERWKNLAEKFKEKK